jgi:hypothetical protein
MTRRLIALLAALAMLAVAACGDDDTETTTAGAETTDAATDDAATDDAATDDAATDDAATDDAATDDAATDDAATDDAATDDAATDDDAAADGGADEEAAQAAILTADDVPEDFSEVAVPDPDTQEDPEMLEELAECLDEDPEQFGDDNPGAESAFSSPDGQEVSSEVRYLPSADEAETRMEIFQNEDTPQCFQQVIDGLIENMIGAAGEDVGVDDISVERLDVPEMGDESDGLEVSFTLSGQGQELTFYLDLILVRVDRAGVSMAFQGLGEPFPSDLAEELTQTVVDRVEV